MVSDCPLSEDSDCRVTGYLKENENKLLLIAYKNNSGESTLSLDLSDFMAGDSFSYVIKDEKGNAVCDGSVDCKGTISFEGEADKLYMIEIA